MPKRAFLLLLLMLAPGVAEAARLEPMTFRVVRPQTCASKVCPAYILGQGFITATTHTRFEALASRVGTPLPVHLNSGGGQVVGGLALGAALRGRRASVFVGRGATCASACVHAFLGGSRRVVSGGRIGVHGAAVVDLASGRRHRDLERSLAPKLSAGLREYVSIMGADPELVTFSNRTDYSKIRFLTPAELRRYRVVTN